MKKLLIFTLLMSVGFKASAQGTWSTGMNEADELKGISGGPYYRYDIEGMGTFVLWDWEDWEFKIITDKGVFEESFAPNTGNYYVMISMGLYTLDGNLTDKFENSLAIHRDNRSAWINKKWLYKASHKKMIKKMFHALKSGEGYVRIVCKRKDMSDFDLKITKYDISEENSTAYKDYPQVFNSATLFCDVNDYGTLDEVAEAVKNKTLKSSTLKKGERFKVLSLDTNYHCCPLKIAKRSLK